MTDPKEIPHLIKLLDDESPDVQNNVARELAAFGPVLKDELKKLSIPLNPIQQKCIHNIFEDHNRLWLRQIWPSWFKLNTDYEKLERALSILAEFLSISVLPEITQRLGVYKINLKTVLDGLASTYQKKFNNKNARQLAYFLFKENSLQGDEDDYYNPQNSNLLYVIKEKRGIPISLTSIYMLVGYRLGIEVDGCHFPGHFLARIALGGRKVYVDCFNAGQIIEEVDIMRIREDIVEGIEKILGEKVDAEMIVKRFLANLICAYHLQGNKKSSQLMIALFKELDIWGNDKKIPDLSPEDIIYGMKPSFKQGQLVRHVRYGYRGIIVDSDPHCQASDDWYYGNQTQPNRHQHWFHILVHGSDQVTYVAQSNLVADHSEEKMNHPLLSYFFTQSKDGHYIRNDNPWPETET